MSGGGVRGRGNGLSAASYAPLVVVESAVVDVLLAALAAEGVAAYASLAGTDGPGPPATGSGDADEAGRVFVDGEQRILARRVLAQALPRVAAQLVEREQEAAFAAIVAGWDTPSERTWPDAEDVSAAPGTPPAPPRATPRPPVRPQQAAPVSGHVAGHDSGDEDEHYVAPPPPPLPRPSGAILLAVAALVLGVALLLAPTLTGLEHRTSYDVVAIGCILGAVALLVSRMRTTSVDDGPDDGAVV